MAIFGNADINRISYTQRPTDILDFLSARSYLLNLLPMIPLEGANTIEIPLFATASGVDAVPATGTLTDTSKTQATTSIVTYSTIDVGSTLEIKRYDLARTSQMMFQPSAVKNVLDALGTNYAQRCFRGGAAGAGVFSGMITLAPSSNTFTTAGANGGGLTLALMDEALSALSPQRRGAGRSQVVGFASSDTYRAIKALLRTAGATGDGSALRASLESVLGMAGATEFNDDIVIYNGVPIFKDDNVPTSLGKGTGTNLHALVFAVIDDGSLTQGIGGFYTTPVAEMDLIDYGMGVHAVPIAGNATNTIRGYNFGWYPGFYCADPTASISIVRDIDV